MLSEASADRWKSAGAVVVFATFAFAVPLTFGCFIGLALGVHQAVGLVECVPDPVVPEIGERTRGSVCRRRARRR